MITGQQSHIFEACEDSTHIKSIILVKNYADLKLTSLDVFYLQATRRMCKCLFSALIQPKLSISDEDIDARTWN